MRFGVATAVLACQALQTSSAADEKNRIFDSVTNFDVNLEDETKNEYRDIPTSLVQRNDVIMVKPGEKVPVDAVNLMAAIAASEREIEIATCTTGIGSRARSNWANWPYSG